MFMDEARFGLIDNPKKCWVKGARPIVSCQTVQEYTYAYAAVNPFNGDMTSLILPYTNTKVMDIFLEEISRRQADRFTLLFLDQAGWHTANDLGIPPNIRLSFIPAYSPELNPTEHIWDELREKCFHNITFDSISAVEDALEIGLRNLERDMQRVQSMTGFEWIVTIE
jgi:transposase